MQKQIYGATMERGEIVYAGTNAEYKVKSIDRPGIVSGLMYGFDMSTLKVGDKVFFFMFGDGSGLVLGKAYVPPWQREVNQHPESNAGT